MTEKSTNPMEHALLEILEVMEPEEHDEYNALSEAITLAQTSCDVVNRRRVATSERIRGLNFGTPELISDLRKLRDIYREGQTASKRYLEAIDRMTNYWERFLRDHGDEMTTTEGISDLLALLQGERISWTKIHEECNKHVEQLALARELLMQPKEIPEPSVKIEFTPIPMQATICVACGKPGVATDDEGNWWCKPHAYMKLLLTGQSDDTDGDDEEDPIER